MNQENISPIMRIQITLADAAYGIEKEVELTYATPCPVCNGQGILSGSPCKVCNGTGQSDETTKSKVRINIPAGIESGTHLRLNGFDGGREVEVTVLSDTLYDRDGDDLVTEYKITAPEAALGTEAVITTVDRKRKISIVVPAGIAYGTMLRIQNEGVRRAERYGNLLVRIVISTPVNLSEKERKLYAKLLELERKK